MVIASIVASLTTSIGMAAGSVPISKPAWANRGPGCTYYGVTRDLPGPAERKRQAPTGFL